MDLRSLVERDGHTAGSHRIAVGSSIVSLNNECDYFVHIGGRSDRCQVDGICISRINRITIKEPYARGGAFVVATVGGEGLSEIIAFVTEMIRTTDNLRSGDFFDNQGNRSSRTGTL